LPLQTCAHRVLLQLMICVGWVIEMEVEDSRIRIILPPRRKVAKFKRGNNIS